MLRWVVVAGLVLSACRGERTHPRLAELTTPVHVTVRAIDLPPDCESFSGVERLRCNTERRRGGCTFVAVGPDADLPLAYSGPMKKEHCDEQGTRRHTVMLAPEPLKSARLFVDPRGDRVLVNIETEGWVLFVRDGKLVGSKQVWGIGGGSPVPTLLADGSPDWPHVPTLLSTWDTTGALLSGLTLQQVMKEDPDPQENLTLALMGDSFRFDSTGFGEGLALLDAPHRERVLDAALEKVKAGEDFAGWFRTQDALKPRYREALLIALRDDALSGASLLNDVAEADPVALRDVTCGQLERSYLGGNLEEGSPPLSALALIARQKLKCPWVLPWLTRLQCDGRLTCVEAEDLDGREHRAPLCTREQIEAAVNEMFHERPDDELPASDDFAPEEHLGEALLGAAAAQGPLPADFLRRTQRRAYEGVEPHECKNLIRPIGSWVCVLPVELTVSTQERCRMTIDDAKKQLTFEELPLPPAGPVQKDLLVPVP